MNKNKISEMKINKQLEVDINMEMEIRIKGNEIRFIHNDKLMNLSKMGSTNIKRASFVEPEGAEWFADLSPVNGPKLGPFEKRQEALDAEVEYLLNNKIPEPN